ncbi:MAG: class I SAM-dependent methyltransferase [Lachnospiraceae bacterium]|nr:class I SAM-dependent methyltransferase [Lachnospiraceae bacterium]
MSLSEKEHWGSDITMSYHEKQYREPKRSTVAFEKFLLKNTDLNGMILDLCCGGGAVDVYLAERHPEVRIKGVDIVDNSFELFDKYAPENIKKRVSLERADLYALSEESGRYDGVIMVQTLSWLKNWKEAIERIIELKPNWFALSSLFYEGKIEFQVKIQDYERIDKDGKNDEAYYNIYSLPIIKEYLREKGYTVFVAEPFNIDIDIEKPDGWDMGTYTIKTEDGNRLQVSGAMLMPWYFVYAAKDKEGDKTKC